MSCGRPARDSELIQIVDSALAHAVRKAGEWLVCRPGCTQCCIGAFAINALDAARLRTGFSELEQSDARRARRVRTRAQAYLQRVSAEFPGDPQTGMLYESDEAQAQFESFANDEVCPVLDPETGTCDLYAFRPMTCRVFGPPVRNDDGSLGVCELCFHGAGDKQIAACEMQPDPDGLEEEIVAEMSDQGARGHTIVAFVLAK
jgi:Fe-S-cluster containining protein